MADDLQRRTIGLRISGRSFKALLIHAAEGLFDLITDSKAIKRLQRDQRRSSSTKVRLKLKAENAAELFLQWLREWLFLFSTKKVIPVQYRFDKLTQKELTASAKCEIFNPRVHEQRYEVKAITYHAFKIHRSAKGWSADVIVDV